MTRWQRFSAWWKGRKTIWAARFYTVAGTLLTLQPTITADFPQLQEMYPNKWWGLIIMGTGILFEVLRRVTDSRARP